jgi:hypothetical protein
MEPVRMRPDGVLVVVVGDDGEDGTEDLLLGDGHGVVDVDEQGRLDEVARGEVRGASAADDEAGALFDGAVDVSLDSVALQGADLRALDVGHVGGVRRISGGAHRGSREPRG